MNWVILLSVLLLLTEPQSSVELNKFVFQQGETIRLEIKGTDEKFSLRFDGTICPVYLVGSSKVALIGIPADFPTGSHELELTRGSLEWKRLIRVKPTRYPRQKIVFPPEKTPLLKLDITEERKIIRDALKMESEKRFWNGVFIVPLDGEITSPYGARRNKSYHRGIDISAKRGTIIRAPAGGKVTVAKDFPIHGKTVVLDHGQGVSTVYCHLDTIFVEEGKLVKKSSPLGKVGSTGLCTASHLHWGLYIHGVPVDPSEWLIQEY